LAPGETKSVPLEAVAGRAGRLSLSASVTTSGGDSVSGDAAVEVSDPSAAPPGAQPAPPPVPVAPLPQPAAPSPAAPKPAHAVPLPPPTDPMRSQSRSAALAGGTALTFDVKDADAALEVGRETTYEIRVLNQGAAPTRDVLVQAVLPDEMTF